MGKKQDQCLELIGDCLFLEKKSIDSRKNYNNGGVQQSTLTLMQEFQLVVVLSEFFSRQGPEMSKNAMFLSLFGSSSPAQQFISRSRVLVRLVSTAVSGSIEPVLRFFLLFGLYYNLITLQILRTAGTWMQQLGPTSEPCLELSRRLVEDFISFSKKCSDQLRTLPQVAPRFTLNFMTSVTDLYLHEQKNGQQQMPPDLLLEIFTDWLTDNPALCSVVHPPLLLPQGAISMPLVTPLAGLISWCVLAPIYQAAPESPCYNRLHLAILQSFLHNRNAATTAAASTTLNALHLTAIIASLKQRSERMESDNERLQIALDRFGQSIQLALTARTLFGNLAQFMCRLETLPANHLLQIVIKSHKVSL